MATLELQRVACRPIARWTRPCCAMQQRFQLSTSSTRRQDSHVEYTPVADSIAELESSSFISDSKPSEQTYDPVGQSKKRHNQLPQSRYQFRPPKYYRGPYHPHQPLPNADPASRTFIPGPFALPRSSQTYDSTIAQDMLSLCYSHVPYGTVPVAIGHQLRQWIGPSPYYKNRPLRPPRGEPIVRPVNRPTTFKNIPKLSKIVIHTMVSKASAENDSAHLHVAGMIIQSITNMRIETRKARHQVVQWGLKKNKYVSVVAELQGEQMHHFLSKLVELVLPKIKDWRGIAGSSGDSVGNISFGLTSEDMVLFPEIEVNYDMYPPKMIPGCHITMQTTATEDKEARLLLASLGLPFHGKLIN